MTWLLLVSVAQAEEPEAHAPEAATEAHAADAAVPHPFIRRLLTNLRLNYIYRPGSDLFLVFNEETGDRAAWRQVANRGYAVKLTFLKRF